MMDGFDKSSPLVCEGIVGDGCGGGRWFYVQEEKLLAYDPATQTSMVLCDGLVNALRISKKGCSITITCKDENVEFNLSSLQKV